MGRNLIKDITTTKLSSVHTVTKAIMLLVFVSFKSIVQLKANFVVVLCV